MFSKRRKTSFVRLSVNDRDETDYLYIAIVPRCDCCGSLFTVLASNYYVNCKTFLKNKTIMPTIYMSISIRYDLMLYINRYFEQMH